MGWYEPLENPAELIKRLSKGVECTFLVGIGHNNENLEEEAQSLVGSSNTRSCSYLTFMERAMARGEWIILQVRTKWSTYSLSLSPFYSDGCNPRLFLI